MLIHPVGDAHRWAACHEFWSCFNFTIRKGGFAVKSNNYLIILSIMFLVLAGGFSVLFWGDVSSVAKIGLFVLGFGSGVTVGQWFARRNP
jgi:hypothetical protein